MDDEHYLTELTSTFLTDPGYSVKTFNNSKEALNSVKKLNSPYDLLITDYMMPGLDGVELSLILRKARKNIPIIICSGFTAEIPEGKLKSLKGVEILSKPVNLLELSRKVHDIIGQND